MKSFSIIGAGKVGVSLGLALVNRGYNLRYLSDCQLNVARRARKIIKQGKATDDNCRAVEAAGIIFICVPDSLIATVADEISDCSLCGKYIFQTSGAVSSKVLLSLARKGAYVASLHPIQTFATSGFDPDIFRGIFFGLEGDRKAVQLGQFLAKKLQARVILISPENKALYHLACSLASNFLVVLLSEVKDLFQALGLKEKDCFEVIYPLLNKTLNNVKELGSEQSLTGPVLRGDINTVKEHLKVVSQKPNLEKLYRLLSLKALKLAENRGLEKEKVKALRHLLGQK
ncbi:MAG: DUF2520 domain-containing protein [Acidobacteriota bacterium]|nr:DUF2520 domain-containing protein [Acidobacteriota bacterium]